MRGGRLPPPLGLLAPFFLLYVCFWLVPLLQGFALTLTDDTLLSTGVFVGAANYLSLLRDPRFGVALVNTALYAAAVVLVVVPLALGLASLLASLEGRLRQTFQLFLLLPSLVAPAALAVLFLLVFYGPGGLLNTSLNALLSGLIGPLEPNWLQDPRFIRAGLVLQAVWRWTGLIAFFLVTGLGAIARIYYEMATLEGANAWQRFIHITLPLLRPLLFFVSLVLVFDAFVFFDGAYVLFGASGGPGDAALLLVNYSYLSAFTFGQLSRAVTMSYLVAPLLLLFVLVFLRLKDPRLLRP